MGGGISTRIFRAPLLRVRSINVSVPCLIQKWMSSTEMRYVALLPLSLTSVAAAVVTGRPGAFVACASEAESRVRDASPAYMTVVRTEVFRPRPRQLLRPRLLALHVPLPVLSLRWLKSQSILLLLPLARQRIPQLLEPVPCPQSPTSSKLPSPPSNMSPKA